MPDKIPKAFISYSWTSPGHRDRIRSYAERLVADGRVDVVLDQWDLSEGQDKYKFMEKMVADPSISHVIIFSDAAYAKKADQRKAGVGTESQIISKEIYDNADQKKFIPVFCEMDDNGEPYLPIFLKSRIGIDFSTPESINRNWERLVRVLHGKPMHTKPELGKLPAYLTSDESHPALPTIGNFANLQTALLENKNSVPFLRDDFLEAALNHLDSFRIRTAPPNLDTFDEKVLEDLHTLLPLRDQFIDWLLLESTITEDNSLEKILVDFLERILSMKYRPEEVHRWNEMWFDTHRIFVYELFLYTIAALLKAGKPKHINEILTTQYIPPDSSTNNDSSLLRFDKFWAHSTALAKRNERLKFNRYDILADIIKDRATHEKLRFQEVMQAELIVFLMSVLCVKDGLRWYPHTLIYSGIENCQFPLFRRAIRHKDYLCLRDITGIESGDELRKRFKENYQLLDPNQWRLFEFHARSSFWTSMNMENLDTV